MQEDLEESVVGNLCNILAGVCLVVVAWGSYINTVVHDNTLPLSVEQEFEGGYDRSNWSRSWSSVNDDLGWRTDKCKWAFYSELIRPDCKGNNHRDHLVAVSEAYKSGGHEWDRDRKKEFYLYLDNLYVLPAGENIRKSDKDPASWLPERNECKYIETWIEIKEHWGLSVDKSERDAILQVRRSC